jgi:hypothetical protein
MKLIMAAALAGLVAGACAPAVETAPVTPVQPAAPPPDARAIPAGTVLSVRLDRELSAAASRVGDTFTVSVDEALVAANGQVVVPEGAVITGMVTGLGTADEPAGQAAVRVNFLRVSLDGVSHPITADIVETQVPAAARAGEDPARAAAVGAAAGAVLGAVITGSLRDALIGAVLGAGAGTVISLGLGDVEQVLPAGTRLSLQTRDRVQLR